MIGHKGLAVRIDFKGCGIGAVFQGQDFLDPANDRIIKNYRGSLGKTVESL